MKRQPMEWENVSAKNILDKVLIPKIYKKKNSYNSITTTTKTNVQSLASGDCGY